MSSLQVAQWQSKRPKLCDFFNSSGIDGLQGLLFLQMVWSDTGTIMSRELTRCDYFYVLGNLQGV